MTTQIMCKQDRGYGMNVILLINAISARLLRTCVKNDLLVGGCDRWYSPAVAYRLTVNLTQPGQLWDHLSFYIHQISNM